MNTILAQLQDRPVFIAEGWTEQLKACVAAIDTHRDELLKAGASNSDFWDLPKYAAWLRPYVVKNGVLHVPVKGILLKDFPYALGSWATGYEYIREAIKRGLGDPEVRKIALVINSGGGMVDGNFELVDYIYESRDIKPINAFANSHAYSAAYNIGSAAQRINVSRSGGVGSIGVVITHVEYSQMLDAAGIKINIIRSKPDKMEGNALEPLTDGARERMQAEVDDLHAQFVTTVARNRAMTAEEIDGTDAHCFMSKQAVEIGLADTIGAFDEAITAFEATISEGEKNMADYTQAEFDAGIASARAEGVSEGATNALVRINAIIGCEAAATRPGAALNAALKTNMPADEAVAFIGSLAEETKAEVTPAPAGAGAPAGMFTAAMNTTPNPVVDAGGGDDNQNETKADEDRALRKQYGLAGFAN